jgi:chorismate synthase
VAEKILRMFYGIEIVAWVDQVNDILANVDGETVTRDDVEANVARCPDDATAQVMIKRIMQARKAGDSLGGIVEAVVRGLPAGWGEPVFDKIDADLAKAMLSLPACKGFEVGSGFGGIALSGSEHNDTFYMDDDRVRTKTNRSGGVQGGITNGENLTMRAAFKPTATIIKEQASVNEAGEDVLFKGRGRHDPCVLPRAVPIVEAMISLTLIDHAMRQQSIQHPASD